MSLYCNVCYVEVKSQLVTETIQCEIKTVLTLFKASASWQIFIISRDAGICFGHIVTRHDWDIACFASWCAKYLLREGRL